MHSDIASCLRQLWAEIRAWGAKVTVPEDEVVLRTDPTGLRYARPNLLVHALIVLAPGCRPRLPGRRPWCEVRVALR